MRLAPPEDYLLARDACSYGYFLLAPNLWDPSRQTLTRILEVESGPVAVTIVQPPKPGADLPAPGSQLRLRLSRVLTRPERAQIERCVRRMLRLDEPADRIAEFHRLDPRWKRAGRGRLFRSPTAFEDVIKTVTSCNVQWPSTVTMNLRLCAVVGKGGEFPSEGRLARARAGTLRARCRVGYRDQRIVELSRLFRSGEVDQQWLDDPTTPTRDIHDLLVELPGIGPYAAANILQLLGRYELLPLDSESIRHGKTILGLSGSDRQIMKKVAAHFEPFGPHRFRSYWFELMEFYESRRGPAHTWDPRTTGATFTASQF